MRYQHAGLLTVMPLLLAAAAAQTPAVAESADAIAVSGATLTVRAGTHDLRTLVRATASFVGHGIAFERDDLASAPTVRLTWPLRLSRDQALDALSNLLFARGFVLCAADRTTADRRVVALDGASVAELLARAPTVSVTEILAHPTRRDVASTTLQLTRTSASAACNGLRPFLNRSGKAADGLLMPTAVDERTVQLTGLQSEVARTITMLRQIDTEPTATTAADEAAPPVAERMQHLVDVLEQRATALEQELARLKTSADSPSARILADATTMIVPAGTHGLGEVLDAAASFLRINVLSDEPRLDAAPSVRVAHTRTFDRDQAMNFASDVLAARGYLLTPLDETQGLFGIVASKDSIRSVTMATWRSVDQIRANPALRQPAAATLRHHDVDFAAALGAMRPMFTDRASLVTFGCCNNETLLLVGEQREIALVVEFVRAMAGGPAQVGVPAMAPPEAVAGGRRIGALLQRIAILEQELAGCPPLAPAAK